RGRRMGAFELADVSGNLLATTLPYAALFRSKVPAGGGTQTTVGSELSAPRGVAVDGAGDVFIADTFNSRVLEVPVGGGAQTTVGSGLSGPEAVALDGAGNVFIADNGRVLEVS